MNHLFEALERHANRVTLLILLALELLFNFGLMPSMMTRRGAAVLDLRFWYTPAQAAQVLSAYTPAQRQAALWGHLTLDVLYPLIYASLFSVLLILIYRPRLPSPRLHRLLWLPWAAALADGLENLGIVGMLLAFSSPLAALTALFTSIKWILVGASGALVLAGLIGLSLRRLHKDEFN